MKRLFLFVVFVTGCISVRAQFSLDECQLFARENYPLIKQCGLIGLSTEYSVSNAAKAYLPQVSFAVQATYQSDVAAFPDQMTAIYEQFGINLKGLNKDQYKMALEVNQSVWDGGFTRAQKEYSRMEGEVSVQSVEAELYALRERINQLYFGILIIEEQLRQNDLLQELLQSNYNTIEAYVKNGVAMQGDLSSVKAEQLSVSQQRVQIESMAVAYYQMLSVMTGKKIERSFVPEKPVVILGAYDDVGIRSGSALAGVYEPEMIISGTREGHRPELRLFEAQSAQFEAQERIVRASVMPRLGIFAQGYYGNPGLNLFKDMTENKWSWNYIAGLRLQWNIGNFYTKKGTLRKLSLAQQ